MPPEQLITATGLRFVGRARALLDPASDGSSSLEPGDAEGAVYAARFQLRPRIGNGSVVPVVLETLHRSIAREWADAPPLLLDRPLARPAGRFHGLRWTIDDRGHAWSGELVWRHTHPTVAGAPCTTHVVLEERPGHTSLAIRVTADHGVASLRGLAGAGQARPMFLPDLAQSVRMTFAGHDGAPSLLYDDEIDDFVRDVVLSETREVPVAVISPLESGGYAVPLDELAIEFLGLASVYAIAHHPTTFRLTDTLGDRRLSCYWGALRVYMPEFSCADRPEDHPLLTHERLMDPVIRAGLLGRLGQVAAERVTMPPRIAEGRVPPASAAPTMSTPARPRVVAPQGGPSSSTAPSATPAPRLEASAASALEILPAVLGKLDARIDALTTTISQLVAANSALSDEIARLRTTTALRSSGAASLERRFETLQHAIRDQLLPAVEPPPADGPTAADTEVGDAAELLPVIEVVRQAATSHGDALLFLENAERAAAESPYEDADRLAVVLDAMAAVARRRQAGMLGTSLRDAFRDLGIDYRGGISPGTSDRMRQQYIIVGPDGRAFDCREHLVLGTSYDPRFCLRVYFTSRAAMEPRFVIGHVGRHFDVKSTT